MEHLSGPIIEDILERYKHILGKNYQPYVNHAERVSNICLQLLDGNTQHTREIIVASAFHDIGIWTQKTMDYLTPSINEALGYIDSQQLKIDKLLVKQLIRNHHKVTRSDNPIIEAFRKADLVDLSLGFVSFRLSSKFISNLKREFPRNGFTLIILQKVLIYALTHLRKPLPMMRH